jgi:hypothetical protein
MAKLTKKAKEAASKLKNKLYSLKDAAALIKVMFLQNLMSLLISQFVGCRSKKSESNGKRCVTLPHGTGKDVKVLALVTQAAAIMVLTTAMVGRRLVNNTYCCRTKPQPTVTQTTHVNAEAFSQNQNRHAKRFANAHLHHSEDGTGLKVH